MALERLIGVLEKKEKPVARNYSVDFCLYCDPDRIYSEKDHDNMWRNAFLRVPEGQKVEVQYETRFDLEIWKNLKNIARNKVDGVHAPSKGRDIADADELHRNWSLEETKRSMDMASNMGAKYFILHLTPQDDFQDRNSQLDRGFKSLEELVKYFKEKNYNFQFLIETLEYPKWPADTKEATDVLVKAKDIFQKNDIEKKLGFCLDVGHLWHNLNSLLPDRKTFNFEEELDDHIEKVSKVVPIEVVHLVGAYVDRSYHTDNNGIHETHAFPVEKPNDFEGEWMDIKTVLNCVSKYGANSGKYPIITIEAHDPNVLKHIDSCRQIKQQIKNT